MAGRDQSVLQRFLTEVVEDDLHVKTILSLANATLGVLHAASLCIHVIGRAYGWATDNDGKHGVKQVDRLLSNEKVSPWALAHHWIAMLVGPREEILVALDWPRQQCACSSLVRLQVFASKFDPR